MDAWDVRHIVYSGFRDTGAAPSRADLDEITGGQAAATLTELHERHAVVVGADGEIRMALPFSAVPTAHRVVSGDRSWWANCAWDALAIPLLLGVDADIESEWADTGRPARVRVRDGELTDDGGTVGYAVPARRWWDDIVET